MLRQLVRSEKALRHGEHVWELQHEMTAIARQHLDDMRMLPIFLTTRFGDLPPGIYVPCDTGALPAQLSRSETLGGRRNAPVPVSDARMRLVFYDVRNGAPAAARARAYAELADWYLRTEHLATSGKSTGADEIALNL